jgi:glutathione synthase/RimK-type ligase-like ATP-grasp enzyme
MINQNKHILILADASRVMTRSFVELVGKNFKNENTKIELGLFDDLTFAFGDGQLSVQLKGKDITEYDLVYIRKAGSDYSILATSLALCLNFLHVPFFDSLHGVFGGRSNKLTSLLRLATQGIIIPKTMYICKVDSESEYDHIAGTLGVPFIAKDMSLQRGVGVFLISSIEDLQKLPKISGQNNSSPYIFQQLIQKEHEYRMLVLKDKVGVWEEKIATAEGEFRNNVALGAREVFLDVKDMPQEMHDLAVDAAQALGIEVAGVDIVVERSTGKLFVLEGNRGPGLTYDESISYEFKALAEFFEREVQ